MKVLFVEDNLDLRQVLIALIESRIDNLEVFEAYSANSAINLVKSEGPFDLIISDYNMSDGDGGVLYNYLKESDNHCAFILMTSERIENLPEFQNFLEESSTNIYLKKPTKPDTLLNTVADLIGPEINENLRQDFMPVRSAFFVRFDKTLSNIYIKLSEDKYVKIFEQNSDLATDQIKKYLEKGIEHFYIQYDDFVKYEKDIWKSPFLTISDKVVTKFNFEDAWEESFNYVSTILRGYGFSSELNRLVFSQINSVSKKIEEDKNSYTLLEKCYKQDMRLIDKSLCKAMIAGKILKAQDWYSKEGLQKLIVSCFFHDITLDSEQFFDHEFYQDDYIPESVLDHGKKAAGLLRNSLFVSNDILVIIEQHHEKPNRQGYPFKVPLERITKLSAVFILAGHLTRQSYLCQFDKNDFVEILNQAKLLYNRGPFKGLLDKFIVETDKRSGHQSSRE